mgnify:CR=1 FL=1
MTKVLNLDSLVEEQRVLTFDGESYKVVAMSVESFIKITKSAEERDAKGDTIPMHERMEFLVDMILPCIPDCPREKLLSRTMEELDVILAFVKSGTLPNQTSGEGVEKKMVPTRKKRGRN